jgi:hypothetical protein
MSSASPLVASLLLSSPLWLAAAPAALAAGEACDTSGPVSLLIVATPAKVREFAASVRDAAVLGGDATTVVFSDGRVVTSDVTAASRHLNRLGWGGRPIDVVASFRRRTRRPGSYG